MEETIIAQMGIAGVTVAILLLIGHWLRADVKEQIANIRSDAKWQAEQLMKIIDECMGDDEKTAQMRAAMASRFEAVDNGAKANSQ